MLKFIKRLRGGVMGSVCKKIAVGFGALGILSLIYIMINFGFNLTFILTCIISSGAAAVLFYAVGEILDRLDYLAEKLLEQQMALKKLSGESEEKKPEQKTYGAQPVQKSIINPPSDKPWMCHKCKMENPVGHKVCVLCHTPKQ